MINIKNKAKCSGCSACANVCPFQCIRMEEDEEGFLYPKVDMSKCRQCGLCEKICPMVNKKLNAYIDIPALNTYACINNDEEERLRSSSGGIFSLLAKCILNQKGAVYGAAMTEDCYGAELIRVDNEKQLYRLRGSKYLQAKVGDSYIKAKLDLDNELPVLFSGTGCQINGLKLFLKKDYDNLFCVDVLCHGAPSPALWKKYVQVYETKYGKLKSVNFRCKEDGWIDFGIKEDSLFISKDKDPYMQMFLNNYCLRPSCYECVAKEIKMADMTIADFWGIENILPEMNDGKGTSLVLIRSAKGAHLLKQIKSELKIKEVSYVDGVKSNQAEYKSAIRPVQRDMFFEDMNSLSFEELKHKYLHISLIARIKKIVRLIVYRTRTNIRGGVKPKKSNEYGILLKFDIDINVEKYKSDK